MPKRIFISMTINYGCCHDVWTNRWNRPGHDRMYCAVRFQRVIYSKYGVLVCFQASVEETRVGGTHNLTH